MRMSAIKGYDAYDCYEVVRGEFPLHRRGRSAVLKAGDQFFLRAATSCKDKYRVVLPALGETIVFSLKWPQVVRLLAKSTPCR
jgi:hypothetical protein